MISKTKSKDIDSLIIKVKNMAKKLMKKKSGNKTLQYTDLDRRQKILIGGNNVKVKLDNETKKQFAEELKTIGYLVHILKASTVQKIYQKIIDTKKTSMSDEDYFQFRSGGIELVKKLTPKKKGIYNFKIFVDEGEDKENLYNKYGVEKEITMLNIVILFYNSLGMNEDDKDDQDDQDVVLDEKNYQNMIEEYYKDYNFEQEQISETVEKLKKDRKDDTDVGFFETKIDEIKESKKNKLKEYYEKIETENEAKHIPADNMTQDDAEEIKNADNEINDLYKQLNTLLKKEEAKEVYSYNPLTSEIKFTYKALNRINSANTNVPTVQKNIEEINDIFTQINEMLKDFTKKFKIYKERIGKQDIISRKDNLKTLIINMINDIEIEGDKLIAKCKSLRPPRSTSTSVQRVKKEADKEADKDRLEEEDIADNPLDIAEVAPASAPASAPATASATAPASAPATASAPEGRRKLEVVVSEEKKVHVVDADYQKYEKIMNENFSKYQNELQEEYKKTMEIIYEKMTASSLDDYIRCTYKKNPPINFNEEIVLLNYSIEITLRDKVKTSQSYLDKSDTIFKDHIDRYISQINYNIEVNTTLYHSYFTMPKHILDGTNRNKLIPNYFDEKRIELIELFKNKLKDIDREVVGFNGEIKTMIVMPNISGFGGKRGKALVKYKSTGQAVYILYKKRKYKRTIYVKDKRNTKYCKIDNEYVLLSKLKIIE